MSRRAVSNKLCTALDAKRDRFCCKPSWASDFKSSPITGACSRAASALHARGHCDWEYCGRNGGTHLQQACPHKVHLHAIVALLTDEVTCRVELRLEHAHQLDDELQDTRTLRYALRDSYSVGLTVTPSCVTARADMLDMFISVSICYQGVCKQLQNALLLH